MILLATAGSAWGAGDPSVDWRTIETTHFLIHYDARNEVLARRLAVIAEEAHEQLVPVFGLTIDPPTDVVIIDTVDSANGSARSVPYNLIRVFAMAPEASSTLGDSDDWLRLLFIHEYLHILHINEVSGLWRAYNLVFGKTVLPNQALPRWYIEGLATYVESAFTEGGRLRNNAYRMYLRMHALAGQFWNVDHLGGFPYEWPGATGWYLYGSDFVDYVVEHYSLGGWIDFNRRVGGALSPLAINQLARETFGHSIVELWEQYAAAAQGEFLAEAVAVAARGETRVEPLTAQGHLSGAPRCRGPQTIGFVLDDGDEQRAIVTTELANGHHRESWVDVFGGGSFDWTPAGDAVVFTQNARFEQVYAWNDLFAYRRATGETTRLTWGARAREPSVSPDGRHVAYVSVDDDSSVDLEELDLETGAIRTLFAADHFELASMPDYSPDGRRVVFSLWRIGHARDLFMVDRATGSVEQLTDDRAQDLDPSFAPDGQTVLFASDRSGIFNAYGIDLDSGRVAMLTNVAGGVFSPRQCTLDGPLFVRTYGSTGFDVGMVTHVQPRDPPASYERPEVDYPVQSEDEVILSERRYRPVLDLYPRSWSPVLSEDSEGFLVGAETAASDPLFHHQYVLAANYGVASERWGAGARYIFGAWPVDISLFVNRFQRGVASRLIAESRRIPFEEEELSAGLNLSIPISDERSGHSLFLGYSLRHTRQLTEPEIRHDPGDIQPVAPEFGRFDDISLGWFWGDARSFAHSFALERGSLVNLFVTVRSPLTGADFESLTLSWAVRHYIQNPWLPGHHLAILLTGAVGRASFNRRPLFAVGGFPDQDLLLALVDQTPIGAGFLRGFEPTAQVGNQFHLLNVEYRFPLWVVDTGAFTLPLFIERFHVAVFADAGTAVDELDGFKTFLVGVGAELRMQAWLSYVVPADLRLGYARGLGSEGINDVYILYGSTF